MGRAKAWLVCWLFDQIYFFGDNASIQRR